MELQLVTDKEFVESIHNRSKSYNAKRIAEVGMQSWWDYAAKRIAQNGDHVEDIKHSDIVNALKQVAGQPEFYLFLNGYIQFLNGRTSSRNAIKMRFLTVKDWLRANGIRIYNEDVKQFIKFPKQIKELRKPLTILQIRELLKNSSKRLQATFLLLISSGLRISECLQLRVRDIEYDEPNNVLLIHVRAETTKTKEERIAYCSHEAWESIQPFIAGKKPMDYILVDDYNTTTTAQMELRFGRVRAACGFIEKYGNGYNYHVNIHSFRAYFHTQATRVLGGDVAHALIGHHKYLDQYFRLTPEERAEQYKKLEPYLTISNETRLQDELERKEMQLQKQGVLEQKILEMEAKLKRANL